MMELALLGIYTAGIVTLGYWYGRLAEAESHDLVCWGCDDSWQAQDGALRVARPEPSSHRRIPARW
ncbi:MAG TPA: hypothetical protein VGA56_06110 [Opitutaceae bacterium]